MAKTTEERFPVNLNISEFEAHLKDMRKKIRKKIEKGKVNDPEKAEAFVELIGNVLALPYFEMNITVYVLMNYLKEDSMRLKVEIAKYKSLADELQKDVDALMEEPEIDEAYVIPDEWKQQHEAEKKKLVEARQSLFAADGIIKMLKKESRLIRDLKGMICRPKGFFAKL